MSDQVGVIERPMAIEAEEALLGSLLIAPEMMREVLAIITPVQIYTHRYRWIFQAMLRLWQNKKDIDLVTLCSELEDINKLDEIGGSAELTRLMSLVPSALHAETYAREINEAFVRGNMLDAANKVAKLAYGMQWGLDQIHSKTVQLLQDCFSGISNDAFIIMAREAMDRQYERMGAAARGEFPGIATGFKDVDHLLLGGPRCGDLVIVAGRPGMGKTAFMLDIFVNNIKRKAAMESDKYDVFFSLEMPDDQLSDRMIAKDGVLLSNVRSGKFKDDAESQVYMAALEYYSQRKFIVVDTPVLTPASMRSVLSKITAKYKIENVFVDYIQLMTADTRKGANRVEEVSKISRELKVLAREFQVVMYAGAQLSRAVEQRSEKRPILSDLRESGSLEQDADIVAFIYRPEIYFDDPRYINLAEIIIAKHRNGPIGTLQLIFRKNLAQFKDAVIHVTDLNASNDKTYRDITV